MSSDGRSMERREMSYPVLVCQVRWLLACLPSSKWPGLVAIVGLSIAVEKAVCPTFPIVVCQLHVRSNVWFLHLPNQCH